MSEDIKKLQEEIDKLKLLCDSLSERVRNIEEGSIGTGVYLDGCPEYATEFIKDSIKKKEGE